MRVLRTVAELRATRVGVPAPLGLVPTMGALHEGHLSLVHRARGECAAVAMSIFVNPAQFGPHEDLSRYPRPIERDLELARQAGVDLVFHPSVEEMYPAGFDTYVEVGAVARRWEGEIRPGHFRGVATVVTKLFTITAPDRAYFGEKDYQQLAVIRRLVADLHLPVAVVGCPTVREPDGLALSSRNVYLTPAQRQLATALSRALQEGRRLAGAGERDPRAICAAMQQILLASNQVTPDYVAVVDPTTLEPLEQIAEPSLGDAPGGAHALIAARLGAVRLIDNARLL